MMKLTVMDRPGPALGIENELALIAARRRADPPAPGTVRPVIRPLEGTDRAALEEMVARCSPGTLRRRFHGSAGDARADRVMRLLVEGPGAVVRLVADADGAVVGVASLHRDRRGDAEMAVLVEDAWQGTGLGRRLTAHLLRHARELGVGAVVADVMREPRFVLEHLQRALAESSVDFDGPVATVRIPLCS